jgi:methionyl-tRNA formyltransferase
MHAHIAALGHDTRVVAVKAPPKAPWQSLSKGLRKFFRLGWASGLEVLTSIPLQRVLGRRDAREISRLLNELPRPDCRLDLDGVTYVPSVNGPEAVRVLRALAPDLIIQAGAGVLKEQIFAIPPRGTLNLHHGIAPLIRGMNSIYWGLWENQPSWIGSTVHLIDSGLDTGTPLAYCDVALSEGDMFPQLFVKATRGGVENLVRVIGLLADRRPVNIPPREGASAYRSTFSGWKMLWLELRRVLRRRRSVAG